MDDPNPPLDITDETVMEGRILTIAIAPDQSGLVLTEQRGTMRADIVLSSKELVTAFATWWGEKCAAGYTEEYHAEDTHAVPAQL